MNHGSRGRGNATALKGGCNLVPDVRTRRGAEPLPTARRHEENPAAVCIQRSECVACGAAIHRAAVIVKDGRKRSRSVGTIQYSTKCEVPARKRNYLGRRQKCRKRDESRDAPER